MLLSWVMWFGVGGSFWDNVFLFGIKGVAINLYIVVICLGVMAYAQKPEDKARHEKINPLLNSCGWEIQSYKSANVDSSLGVAVEYFQLSGDEADYVLFVEGKAVGIIEAKKEEEGALISKESQAEKYSKNMPEWVEKIDEKLPFCYIATGSKYRFTNYWDPEPRSREVFAFHRPEYFQRLIKEGKEENLRKKLAENHSYENKTLWQAQKESIDKLKNSFAENKSKALVQMATGSGKTYMCVNLCYYLKKYCGAKKILFLVDRGNLQTNGYDEFDSFNLPDDGRKFTDVYNVRDLKNNKIGSSDSVVVSTIQRMYSILKGEKEAILDENGEVVVDDPTKEREPFGYNPNVPIEEFDFIIVDECHRSIYNLWKQVLDYFDAFLVGITATPSKGTIGFFDNNLVMEYGHKEAVLDGVNLDYGVYDIQTEITKQGSYIPAQTNVKRIDMRTKMDRWKMTDDEVVYSEKELDVKVVTPDQIRKVVRTFKDRFLWEVFPNREYVPKTLIFAKDDAHAEMITQIIREEFNKGNDFCQKITYKLEGKKPAQLIKEFRNELNPRIAVTVDMIATGTDIKTIEVVMFMRKVNSRQYFEQMKGRGCRVMKDDDFREINKGAYSKDRFYVVDCVGVCRNEKLSETEPIDRVNVSFDSLIRYFQYGRPSKEHVESLAIRLKRLSNKLREDQNKELNEIYGKPLIEVARELIDTVDNDKILEETHERFGENPSEEQALEVMQERIISIRDEIRGNSAFLNRLQEVRKEVERMVDDYSLDVVIKSEFSVESREEAEGTIESFAKFIQENKDELNALKVYYNNSTELKWKDLKDLVGKIKAHGLTDSRLWNSYKILEGKDKNKHIKPMKARDRVPNFVSLLRHEIEKTNELEPYLDTVEKRFSEWIGREKEAGVVFSEEEYLWLEKMKDCIAENVEIDNKDLMRGELQRMGGLGKASEIFGEERLGGIINKLNGEVGGK